MGIGWSFGEGLGQATACTEVCWNLIFLSANGFRLDDEQTLAIRVLSLSCADLRIFRATFELALVGVLDPYLCIAPFAERVNEFPFPDGFVPCYDVALPTTFLHEVQRHVPLTQATMLTLDLDRFNMGWQVKLTVLRVRSLGSSYRVPPRSCAYGNFDAHSIRI